MKLNIPIVVPVLMAGLITSLSLSASDDAPTTREEQASITPDQVLKDLLDGNTRFIGEKSSQKNWKAQVKASAEAQFPKAVILSCLDSRVPVETVFDQGIGDVFVARVAGNIEGAQTLGSIEFATQVAGAKLIMVLGHEACGAVKGAIHGATLGHLTELLAEIRPAVESAPYTGERESENPEFVDAVVRNNVRKTVADIRKRSDVIRDLEKVGSIRIVGAHYSLHSGKVTIID